MNYPLFARPVFLTALMLAWMALTACAQDLELDGAAIELQVIGEAPDGAFFVPDVADSFHAVEGDNVMVMSSSIDVDGGQAESGLMHLLDNKSIREEIELIDSQYEKMRKFQKAKAVEMRQAVKGIMNGGKIDINAIKEMAARQQESARKELEEMLLPHQVSRLRQLSHQVRLQNRGAGDVLTSGVLARELGLTDEEKSDLATKAAEIEARVKAEIAQLKSDARRELIGTLPDDKQKKLKELIGEDFKYEKPDMRARFREMRKQMEERAAKVKESKPRR